jgi:hypothetical protein
MLQWATGGLLFLWVTTRHRLVGLGYGWLLRGVFGVFALIAAVAGGTSTGRTIASVCVVVACVIALASSVQRKAAGVTGGLAEAGRKRARVAAMTHADPELPAGEPETAAILMRDQFGRVSQDVSKTNDVSAPEFDPRLDLLAPLIGAIGLVFAAVSASSHLSGANVALNVARTLVGALFLGAVSDAMLLGHWYLTQPGLSRRPIVELNDWLLKLWPVEVVLLLIPTGMVSVINGSVDDKWGGMLGWMWIACALTTGVLAYVTRIVLNERYYSAVMAATGMLYLAILTAFGTDIVARAVLQG